MIIVHHGSLLQCPLCDFCTADPPTLDVHRDERHSNATAENGVDVFVKKEGEEDGEDGETRDERDEWGTEAVVDDDEKAAAARSWSGHSLFLYQQALSSLSLAPNVRVTLPQG
jgi:hypothetical protein